MDEIKKMAKDKLRDNIQYEFKGNVSNTELMKQYAYSDANVISIASIQLIITSISSTQTAIFRRNFEFRKLFIARISVAIAPLVITVPLAIILRTYWALVIGNLCGALVNSIVLSVFSNWKPSVYYSFKLLKKMFSYSFWSLCEALANWTIFWVDTFIVGNYFSEYQLGLYKNSTNMVQSIMGMISASMSPVLLSTLSRLKNNPEKYKKAFLNIHSLIIYLVAPMGIGLFLYRKMATLLLFGSKWGEASNIVGAWGLMMMCSVIFYSFPAELYKSKGIPQMLFLSQCIYLLFMIPICVVTAKFGLIIIVVTGSTAYKRKSQKTHHFSRNFRTSSSGNPENLEISSGEKLGSCSMRCAVNKACS